MLFVKSLPGLMTELNVGVSFESNTETILRVSTTFRALPVTLLMSNQRHCYLYFRRLRTMKTLQVIPAHTIIVDLMEASFEENLRSEAKIKHKSCAKFDPFLTFNFFKSLFHCYC